MKTSFLERLLGKARALGFATAAFATLFGVATTSISGAHAQSVGDIEAAAKKEGTLVWYVAMRSAHIEKLAELFMKKYPEIEVETVHLSSGDITARIMTEYRGRQYNVDIASASSYAIAQLEGEDMLEPFVMPKDITANLEEGTYDPEGYWLSQYALTFPISYNVKKLEEEGLSVPTSFEELTEPKWKGKFAISSDYYDWYGGLIDYMGREKAKALAEKLAANEPLVRSRSGAILRLLEAGEFAATFHVYGYNTFEQQKKGKPVGLANVAPVVTTLQTGGILKNARHPNAAKLFQIWMASKETQQFIISVLGRTSTHPQIDNVPEVWNPAAHTYVILDPEEQTKRARENLKEYKTIFGIRG